MIPMSKQSSFLDAVLIERYLLEAVNPVSKEKSCLVIFRGEKGCPLQVPLENG